MKTLLFTILLLGWDIRNQQMFHSKIIKNHACKPNIFMMLQMTENIQKVIKNPVQRGTQNPSKIMKNLPWDLPKSLRVHLRPTSLQNGVKMVPKELQMIPKW